MENGGEKGKQKQVFQSFNWEKWNVKPRNLDNQNLKQQQQQQSNFKHPTSHPSTSEQNIDSSTIPISGYIQRNPTTASDTRDRRTHVARKPDDSLEDVNSISRRLEELKLVAHEPELSAEQLRINDQLQQDEILSIEAIYGKSVIILDREDGLRSFQINVHIEAPDELQISTKLHSSSGKVKFGGKLADSMAATDNPNEFFYTFKVQYLPPIELTCLLPKSYPSHLCPYFAISVPWLDSMRISNLCRMLDSIWMELSGQEIIYQWTEWLMSSSLSYLGFGKEIVLGPYNMPNAGDRRAVSRNASPDANIPSMMKYNDDKCLEIFHQNLQECCICLGEYAGIDFVRLPCKHFFCRKCMETYSSMHVKEGTVYKLLCPAANCGGLVPPGLLKRLLGDEEFKHWESLLLQRALDTMSDIVYCPRCETACLEDEDEQYAQCPKCLYCFCGLCKEGRHVGVTCMTPQEKLQILQRRQSSPELKEEQRCKERRIIEEILSVKKIFRDAKQCPSCNMSIARTEGCNKMVCQHCGQFFCYRCNEAIDGYGHYRDGGCVLLANDLKIPAWEARVNYGPVLAQMQEQVFADHGHSFPRRLFRI